MNRMQITPLVRNPFILAAALVGAVGLFQLATPSANLQGATTEAPKPAPAWELKDVEGKAIKSTSYLGKVVLLDFWATWCPPCREEIPSFIALQKKYEKQGLVVIGVSMDQEGPSIVKPFIKKNGINYPVVMGNDKLADAYGGIEGIPTTFVIDRQGRIVAKHVGLTEKAMFEKAIQPLLKAQ